MSHPHQAPTWFRYGVIAAAVMVLCSCRAQGPAFRVAGHTGAALAANDQNGAPTFDDDASFVADGPAAPPLPRPATPLPRAATPRVHADPALQLAAHNIPSHLTPAQLAQATALPPGFQPAPCGPGGCPCCGPGVGAHGAIRGPNDEYLCDGGDMHLPAAVARNGNVLGLDPEDAIAHYETIDGRTVVTPSNKVCIYAPRFAAVREVVDLRAFARIDAAEGAILDVIPARADDDEGPATSLALLEPNIHRVKDAPSPLRGRQQLGELDRDRRVAATIGTLAPYANLQTIRTGEVVGRDIVKLARASVAAITWTANQAAQVLLDSRKAQAEVSDQTPGTIYLLVEPNNPKLRLIKLASTGYAEPGDEVEFTLRFDNVGDRVIGNVTILDSLTTRLEYIEGTQKSSVQANFEHRVNEGDSLNLRWEITEPLQPGEGGIIQFRCRVR